VIVNCKIVANETQSKYGIWTYAIHLACGYMAIMAQIRVPSTSKISTAAKRLFCKPNCIGVKIKLKIKFRIKGKRT